MSSEVSIKKNDICDETIRSILESVVFQNDSDYKLMSYQVLRDRVILTYEESP
jgi:hypothetical protein